VSILTSLIILEGQGIDVILGMNWMKMHKTILDISASLVHLDSSNFGNISLQLPHVAHLQASVHAIIAKSLDEIPVVHEYLDVFSNDLPGIAPVYKCLYPMAPHEMAEIKTQLQELLNKGYI
jgi:hypothetical protein